jgi:hypothetical protein
MFKFYLIFALVFVLISCKKEEPNNEISKKIDSLGAIADSLQKKADSIIREQDSLSVPR